MSIIQTPQESKGHQRGYGTPLGSQWKRAMLEGQVALLQCHWRPGL